MKRIEFILFKIITAFLISCNNDKGLESSSVSNSVHEPDTLLINIEFVYDEFDLCEPDPSIYPILDLVVNSSKNCPELKNKGMLYCLWIYLDEDSLTRVKIELREKKRIYCLSIVGIFTYKGLIFGVNSNKKVEDFFSYTGLKVKYFCMKENILLGNYNDDVVAHWEFIIKKDMIKNISYNFCDQHWMDKRYYKTEYYTLFSKTH